MSSPNDNVTNGVLSLFSTGVAFLFDPQIPVWITAIVLPICFFCAGKAVDIAFKYWLDHRKPK